MRPDHGSMWSYRRSSLSENSAKFVRPLHAWECNQEMLLTSKQVNQNGGEN